VKAKFTESNCGVAKNVGCRCRCRYTVYHTENSNHLEQNNGTIWHQRSMLVNDNMLNIMFLKNKRNYHETTYDGAIGIKETF